MCSAMYRATTSPDPIATTTIGHQSPERSWRRETLIGVQDYLTSSGPLPIASLTPLLLSEAPNSVAWPHAAIFRSTP